MITTAIAASDICLPSFDDLAVPRARFARAMVEHCLGLGARIVALKHGANGAGGARRAAHPSRRIRHAGRRDRRRRCVRR
jgi:hypothetical protein